MLNEVYLRIFTFFVAIVNGVDLISSFLEPALLVFKNVTDFCVFISCNF